MTNGEHGTIVPCDGVQILHIRVMMSSSCGTGLKLPFRDLCFAWYFRPVPLALSGRGSNECSLGATLQTAIIGQTSGREAGWPVQGRRHRGS